MQVKTCPATVKAAGAHEGTDEGIVEAIVAAYNVDSVGDRIIPGAFAKTLERRKASGHPIPFVWNHQSDDPHSYVGEVLEAEERPEGLWVKARMDLDEATALKVYKLLKGRRVNQFSFAYAEIDARPAAKNDDGARKELYELDLFEAGPTMLGANQATSLLDVKHQQPVTVNVNNVMPGAKADQEPADEQAAPEPVADPPVEEPEQPAEEPAEDERVTAATRDLEAAQQQVAQAQAALAQAREAASGEPDAEAKAAVAAIVAALNTVHDDLRATFVKNAHIEFTPDGIHLKAGRVLSAANLRALRDAVTAIEKVLAAAGPADQDSPAPSGEGKSTPSSVEKATPAEPAAAPDSQVAPEAAPDVKSDEPAAHGTASARLRHDLAMASLEAEVAALTI